MKSGVRMGGLYNLYAGVAMFNYANAKEHVYELLEHEIETEEFSLAES